jgi:hypothetical protein
MRGSYSDFPTQQGDKQTARPGGARRKEPHPNGGEVQRLDVPRSKMPKQMSSSPITHTPLNTDLGKMPKQMSGPRQVQPRRR